MGEEERSLFSPAQAWVLLALVAIFGAGLFVVRHAERLRAGGEIVAGDASEYAFVVDVNGAKWEELALLPGIGEGKAKAIVAYREEHGAFKGLEDLQGVAGIGEKTAAGMAEYVEFGTEREPGGG